MNMAEDQLMELVARQRIQEVIFRYCRAVDRLDMDEMRRIFWEDGVYEGGPFPDNTPASEFLESGLEDFIKNRFAVTKHLISNVIIDFEGDAAFSESSALCYHVSHPMRESREALIGKQNADAANFAEDEVIEFVLSLRYLDRFEQRQGEWRIANRRLALDWSRVTPYKGITSGGLLDVLTLRASRDKTDPLYLRRSDSDQRS